jgi:hypothetical protein
LDRVEGEKERLTLRRKLVRTEDEFVSVPVFVVEAVRQSGER